MPIRPVQIIHQYKSPDNRHLKCGFFQDIPNVPLVNLPDYSINDDDIDLEILDTEDFLSLTIIMALDNLDGNDVVVEFRGILSPTDDYSVLLAQQTLSSGGMSSPVIFDSSPIVHRYLDIVLKQSALHVGTTLFMRIVGSQQSVGVAP